MNKVSYDLQKAINVLKLVDEPGLLTELKLPLVVWLEQAREYALDYEENNKIENTPFSKYRSDFRYALSFAYKIIDYGKRHDINN